MRLMIDLETLSTRPDAAISSLGWCAFDNDGVVASGGCALDMKSVFGHMDPSTVAWWMKQNEAARAYSFNGATPPAAAAMALANFVASHKPDTVWANSPSFDLIILQSWWRGLKEEARPKFDPGRWPFTHRMERDCRTMFALANQFGIDYSSAWSGFTAHNPVDDACCQARSIILIEHALAKLIGREPG